MPGLEDHPFPAESWPRERLIGTLREAGRMLREASEERIRLLGLIDQLRSASAEAEYWKGVADSLEFGDDRPDYSPPPRADGASDG